MFQIFPIMLLPDSHKHNPMVLELCL